MSEAPAHAGAPLMSKPTVTTAREIKRQVADLWELYPEDLDERDLGRSGRALRISHARHEAMFRMRHELPIEPSWNWIAHRFGEPAFNHRAVEYGIKAHARRLRDGTLQRGTPE